MRIRSVFKWFVFLLLLAAVGVAGTFWWFWNQSDQLLYNKILSKLEEKAPGWSIQLGDANFDWQNQSRVYLSNLSLRAPGQTSPLIEVPTAVVYLDGDLLRENIQIILRKIRFQDCHLNVIRRADGSWNLEALETLDRTVKQELGFPEIIITQASVNLELEHPNDHLSTQFSVDSANFHFVPGGKKLYQVNGEADVSRLGLMQLWGDWDLNHGRWELNGSLNGLPADQSLLELISEIEPESREKLVRVDRRLHQLCSSPSPSFIDESSFDQALAGATQEEVLSPRYADSSHVQNDFPVLAVGYSKALEPEGPAIPNFGLSGEMQVNFRLSQSAPRETVDYRLLVQLLQGELNHPLLPFPLRQLEGNVYLDRHQLLVRDVKAVNGKMELDLSADLAIQGLTTPGKINVSVKNVPLSQQLKQMLNPGLQKIYDSLNPSGVLNLEGTFHYDGFGNWTQEDVLYQFEESTVVFEKFRYPIHRVGGTIVPEFHENGDIIYQYQFTGQAGQRPVTLTGWSRPKDQGGELQFQLSCTRLPVDETFVNACPPAVQVALRSLDFHGETDLNVKLTRGRDQMNEFDHELRLDVSDGSLEYDKFPYPVREVSGKVFFDSTEGVWHITSVTGKHSDATITAAGTVIPEEQNDRLELRLMLADAVIDHQLEHALSGIVPDLWDQLSPSGRVSAQARIQWMPDRGLLNVELPDIRVTDGGLMLKSFRYNFDDVSAELSYANDRVEITKFSAKHDDTRIRGRGEFQVEPGGLWRLTLPDLDVDDLLPDRQFRNALPPSMAEALDTLAPEGRVTFKDSLLELRGGRKEGLPVTAAWDLKGIIEGVDLFVGVDVKDARGTFRSLGTWDGRKVVSQGEVKLDSAFVLNQHLKRVVGPFSINDREVIVGTIRQDKQSQDPLTAELLEGTLRLNARAVIGTERRNVYGQLVGEPTTYKALLRLNGAKLEEYLRRQGGGNSRLQGDVNARLVLEGSGQDPANLIGEGRIEIKPAALYELPVVLRIFQTLNITAPPDRAAFDEAIMQFQIRNEQFEFSSIDLLGNALSLRGRGTVRFDEKIDLEFFSIVPKSQPVIPLVREIVRSASYGLVAVDVKGSISDPKPIVKTNFVLDNALRNFLGTFQPFRPVIEDTFTPPRSTQGVAPNRQ
ncbi:MAG: hypothetical protein HUJ26_21195 [Planctomycetaceae bacterium]|nr:hypothetical protein [Planctomycetaceae bacterium]